MKYILLFFIFVGLLIGCRHEEETPLPNIFPELLILDISFPGIPKENVRIDQPNRRIYVKMPALLTTNNLKPTITLSEKARLAAPHDLDRIAQPGNWCYWRERNISNLQLLLAKKTRVDQGSDVRYEIYPEPMAPLNITQTNSLFNFTIGETSLIHVDAENIYGNIMPQTVIFTHNKTEKQILLHGEEIINCFYYPNRISIRAYNVPFERGEYNMKIQQVDGKLLAISPTLTTVVGKSRIEHQLTVLDRLSSLPGKTLILDGRNLFSGLVEFRLLFPNGTTLPLKAAYSSNGNEAQVDIPPTLQAGYYGIEIVREGQPLGICYRLSIVGQQYELFIGALNKLPGRQYPTDSPLTLVRNKPIPVSFGPIGGNLDRYIVALVDPNHAATIYRFSLTWPIEADANFTIPSSVPSGRYKAVMQEIDPVTQKSCARKRTL
jgi:hypothetical protein